jgi:hydrogenase expression/formation protein HypE
MKTDKIILDHGSGGKLSSRMINEYMLPIFDNPILSELNDGAVVDMFSHKLAFSTDTYTVDPLFFPGGSIGDLAVNGTVNDIAMCGAVPLYLSAGFVIEEGFPMADLITIMHDMATAAKKAGVTIVTGDTKVVPNGAADKIFINTSGVGAVVDGVHISGDSARPGDQIILSGSIADHGMTILAMRGDISFDAGIKSDSAPLNRMVERMLATSRHVHALRDPTRGGLGTALNEIARQSKTGIRIMEAAIPVKDEVSGICDLLGFDPLYVANEGKLIAFVAPEDAEALLYAIREDPFGQDACIIGEVIEDDTQRVVMETLIGGTRIVDMLAGEQLPRIC